MTKRSILCLVMAIFMVFTLVGCSKGVQIATDLGGFHVIHASFMDSYDTMNASSGNTLLVVRMTADTEFDETRFKSHFAAEDGSSAIKAAVGGTEYACKAVAYQGKANSEKIEYVLVFEVASAATTYTSFALTPPNQPPVTIEVNK
ncbi:MAG: hypothetical protein IJP30_02265 [Clostridia bacterium]|nr:hypothetical protein [Clostridia bacterium]